MGFYVLLRLREATDRNLAMSSDTMLQKYFTAYCEIGGRAEASIQAGKPSMTLKQFMRVISDVRLLGETKGSISGV